MSDETKGNNGTEPTPGAAWMAQAMSTADAIAGFAGMIGTFYIRLVLTGVAPDAAASLTETFMVAAMKNSFGAGRPSGDG